MLNHIAGINLFPSNSQNSKQPNCFMNKLIGKILVGVAMAGMPAPHTSPAMDTSRLHRLCLAEQHLHQEDPSSAAEQPRRRVAVESSPAIAQLLDEPGVNYTPWWRAESAATGYSRSSIDKFYHNGSTGERQLDRGTETRTTNTVKLNKLAEEHAASTRLYKPYQHPRTDSRSMLQILTTEAIGVNRRA